MKFDGFEIIIRPTFAAIKAVMQEPGKWNVVSIREKGQETLPLDAPGAVKSMTVRFFYDLEEPIQGKDFVLPSMEDVEEVLSWAKGKDPILVHCQGGVSRSSAMAYLIACSRTFPCCASNVLNPMLHWPNQLVVALGAKCLGNVEVHDEIVNWKLKVKSKGSEHEQDVSVVRRKGQDSRHSRQSRVGHGGHGRRGAGIDEVPF